MLPETRKTRQFAKCNCSTHYQILKSTGKKNTLIIYIYIETFIFCILNFNIVCPFTNFEKQDVQ